MFNSLNLLPHSPSPQKRITSQMCLSMERRGKSSLVNSETVAVIQCRQTTKPLFCDAFQGHTSWPWEGIWGDLPSCQKGFLPKNSILSQEVKPAVFSNLDPKSSVCLVLGVQVDHQRRSHCLKQKPVLTGWLGVRGQGPRSEKKKKTEMETREVEFWLP